MIVRFGGGNSGIAEYLEKGAKHDRHYSRDELDNRIIIDGDLEVTNKIINDITDKNQERYLHITLSFNEPDVTVEKMQAAYEDYKSLFLTAYKEGEINTYAEIHWPKTQQLLDKSTHEMYDRFPHIHMVIPKQNLLTGGYTNPRGLYDRHMNIWEAIQEDVNNKHGLKSPAHSPRISIENYKAVLDRHKIKEFNPKYKAAEVKRELFNTIEKQDLHSWQDFKDLVSSHGEVKIRNEGKATEYFAVKLPNNDKFTNLNNPIFSKAYIEKREIPHKPLTQYQIDNRLKQWEVVSKEIKYIDDASAVAKKLYRALGDEQKVSFLQKYETNFYEEHAEKELSESKQTSRTLRSSYSKFDRGREADRRSLHDLPSLHLVHNGTARGEPDRTELLLSDNKVSDIQFSPPDSDAGLQRSIHTTARVISDKAQIKSLTSQIIFDIEEGAAIDKANELQLFKEIRTNLNPDLVLAYAQAKHLINPEDHKHFKAKDGSARISFGKFNYNVSDFFTKGLGLEWKETEVILKSLYEAQTLGVKVEPVSNVILKECFIDFEERIYSVKLEQFKRVTNSIDKDKSLSLKEINNRYHAENRRIKYLELSTWQERENLKSLNAFEKLVAEEYLKANDYGNRQDANAIKYPFSDHFEKYLTQQKVIDMSLINELKQKFEKEQSLDENIEINSISGKGFDFVLNGKEAARRAKLTAQLVAHGQPDTRYGYSFKTLTPEQQKDSVVFRKDGEKLFETKSNRTTVLGALDFDKTATALAYSMQRYGNPLDIKGTDKFREQIIEVSARNGLKVEFTDPTLNEALKNRMAELNLEAANENSIAAQDLELDKSLGERAAVDKAMLESKQREIETDLKEPNQAALELAAVAIAQRLNAHEHEPVTAETAELDVAVFKELNQSPALQAYFAVEMSKIGATNADYRAEFIKNEPEEFMLANHAARKFTDELETAYQSNKPQEELDLTLDDAIQPEALNLSALYAAELILHGDKRTDFGTATDTTALDAWDVSSKQYELLTARIAERLESGEIPSDLQSQADPDYLDAAKDIVLATDFKTIDSEALKTLTGEDFERPSFESIQQEQWQPEAPVNAPETIDKDVEKELHATPAFGTNALEEHLELDPAAPTFEPATDGTNEPTKDLDDLEMEYEQNRPVLGSQFIEAEPVQHLNYLDQQAANIIVAQLKDLERIEIKPVAAYAMENATMTLQDHGTATIERNQEGGWTVTATDQDNVYTFKSDDIEQAAKNFVSVSVPLNGMEESTWTPDSAKLELFKQNLEAHSGQIDGFAMADQAKQLDQHFDKYTEQQELGEAVQSVSEFQSSTVETVIAQANYEQVTKEVEKYQDIFASAYMRDGYNDMIKGSLNEESKDSPRYVDEAQKGALAMVVENFKENNLANTDGKAISITLEEFKADTQQLVNQELAAKGLPEFDIASYNKYENPIKIETLEALKVSPEPLSYENANAKNIVNELDSLESPETEKEARTTAKAISTGLNELRGRPELGQAALVVVALVDSSPALQSEMAKIAEFDSFSPVVIETTREASQTMQMTQPTPDVDMEM